MATFQADRRGHQPIRTGLTCADAPGPPTRRSTDAP